MTFKKLALKLCLTAEISEISSPSACRYFAAFSACSHTFPFSHTFLIIYFQMFLFCVGSSYVSAPLEPCFQLSSSNLLVLFHMPSMYIMSSISANMKALLELKKKREVAKAPAIRTDLRLQLILLKKETWSVYVCVSVV